MFHKNTLDNPLLRQRVERRMTSNNDNDSWKDHIDTTLTETEQYKEFSKNGFNVRPPDSSSPEPESADPSKELMNMLDEAHTFAAQFASNKGILKQKIGAIIGRMDEEGLSLRQQRELLKYNFRPIMSESWYYEILKENGLGRGSQKSRVNGKGKQQELPNEVQAMVLSNVNTDQNQVLKEHTITVLECHPCAETMKFKKGFGPIDTFYECPRCKCRVRLLQRTFPASFARHFESKETNLGRLHKAGFEDNLLFRKKEKGEAAS